MTSLPTPSSLRPATRAVRAGIDSDAQHGAVVPPLHLSSNFTFAGFGRKRRYDYSRTGNPTRDQLGDALAALEGGARAVVTSSGMAAVHLALQLVPPGGRVVAPHDGYGGTWRLLDAQRRRGAFAVELIDQTAADAVERIAALRPDLLWIETPSNPLLRIADLAVLTAAGHACGARVVVDNTFLSPALQQPIAFGADVVVHSTTKYLNGHSDVVGGAVIARDAAVGDELAWWGNCLGLTGAPFDAWLTLRGVRTLHARMGCHLANAAAVVAALTSHPAVAVVHWPGLPDHPGHALAQRQQSGFGAMVAFELVAAPGADRTAVERFLDGLRCFSLAESLGGVESLVAHPATMTHAAMSADARAAAGITDRLLRLSVGIEHSADLVADLVAGLDRVVGTRKRAGAVVAPTRRRASARP